MWGPVHTGSKKLQRPQSQRGGTHCPLWVLARNQLFFFSPSPSQSPGKGAPREPGTRESPGAHLQRRRLGPAGEVPRRLEPGVLPPRLSKFRPPRLAPRSCHKCTDCGDPRGPQGTYPLSCSLMAARAPRTGEGERMSELPSAAGSRKVGRRRRPGSQQKALRRSGRGLPGGRADGRRPGGRGGGAAGRRGGTGPRSAPQQETREPGLRQTLH